MFKFAYPVLWFDLSEITEKKYVAKQSVHGLLVVWPCRDYWRMKVENLDARKKTVQHKDLKLV